MKNENAIKDIVFSILTNYDFITAKNFFIELGIYSKRHNIDIDYDDCINYILYNIANIGDINVLVFSYEDEVKTNFCFYLSKNKILEVYQHYHKNDDTGIYP
jgi:hypothetical protein